MAVVITGTNTPTAGGITYGDGTTYATTAAGTLGQVLQSNGASAPTWTTAGASLTTPSFTTTIGVGAATASASGAGITFPATQSASSDANTLDDYEEGTFTFTGTGFTTSPTGTAYYTKIGDQVTLRIPDITGLSNTTAMTITGLPVG